MTEVDLEGRDPAEAEASAVRASAQPPHSLAFLYPITFFSGTILIALGPVLDPIIKDLGLPLSQGGLLAAAYAGGRVVALLVLNLFLAKVTLKRLVVGAALLQAVGLAAPALFVDSLGPLLASLAVVGAAVTIPIVVPGIWMGVYAKYNIERAMMLTLTFLALGVVVSPLAIGAALSLGAGWRWVFGGEAVFAVLVAVAVAVLPLADVPGRENLRIRHLRETVSVAPGLLATMLIGMFFYIGAEHILNIWLSEFQIETFGASQGVAATALALFFGGIMAGRYLALPLLRRMETARILGVSCALMAAFILATAFAPTLAVSQVCVFLAGAGASASYPMLSSYANRFPAESAGLIFSSITMVVIISGAVFAYAAGPLAEAMGMRTSMAVAAVPAVAVLGLSFILPRRLTR